MEREYYRENPSPYLLKFREALHYLLIPVLTGIVIVLYLEFFAHVGHSLHEKLKLAEKLILFYFVAEVGTDFVLFENKRTFLSEKWFDILLILPFLQAFRAVGRAGQFFRGVKAFKSVQLLQLPNLARTAKMLRFGEIPVAAGLVAGEGARGIRLGKAVPKLLKTIPKVQKLIHFVREMPTLLQYVPSIQSVVYLLTQVKIAAKKAAMVLLPASVIAVVAERLRSTDDEE